MFWLLALVLGFLWGLLMTRGWADLVVGSHCRVCCGVWFFILDYGACVWCRVCLIELLAWFGHRHLLALCVGGFGGLRVLFCFVVLMFAVVCW